MDPWEDFAKRLHTLQTEVDTYALQPQTLNTESFRLLQESLRSLSQTLETLLSDPQTPIRYRLKAASYQGTLQQLAHTLNTWERDQVMASPSPETSSSEPDRLYQAYLANLQKKRLPSIEAHTFLNALEEAKAMAKTYYSDVHLDIQVDEDRYGPFIAIQRRKMV